EMAKKYNIEMEVRSSLHDVPGTIVKEEIKMEKMLVKSVAKDADVASIMIVGLPDEPGIAFKIFSRIANANINVDMILQSVGRDGTKDIAFTVPGDCGDAAVEALREYGERVGVKSISQDKTLAKVSIVGAGMETHEGVAAQMFEALSDAKINISMISTSEIKVSALLPKEDADRAVQVIHDRFFGNN
ncbi:MAG: ACT domain-containing protein, partial [Clostridia bacterium]|nr:ACT domain-containing protein [Clostridia bacterium]